MTFAQIDIEGRILNVTKGNPDWPSVGQGEWVPYPFEKADWSLTYNRDTRNFENAN